MNEYFCTKCHRVFLAGDSYAKCCGDIERFSLEKHGRLLISSSNGWINVWEKWKDNPMLNEVISELAEIGCSSAATTINCFIEKLLDQQE
jgi:hypothetical protein